MADSDDDALLLSLGIAIGGDALGEVRAACARIARTLHADGIRVVGFVPS